MTIFKPFQFDIGRYRFKGYFTGVYFSLYVQRGTRTPDGWTWDEE